MSRVRVSVFRLKGRPFYVAEWKDPLTGKAVRVSTKKSERREAERYAVQLEKDLENGDFIAKNVEWDEFRELYEGAHASKWANGTKLRVASVLDSVERIISPRYLRGLNAAAVTRFTNELVKAGNAGTTIAAALRHLKAALRWAVRKGHLARVPDIDMPEGSSECGGRSITLEEFERMLDAVPKVPLMKAGDVESWRRLLWLLWNSGLRIGEAHKLHWTDPKNIRVDIAGKYPTFEIAAQASKNGKAQRFPMSGECFEWLQQVPEAERQGLVVQPTKEGKPIGYITVVKTISAIGRKANVIVGRDARGNPTFASAHDLRRSAGTRWAARVMPSVLQAMMRHASPTTTAKFYTDQAGEPILAAVWEATCKKAAPTDDPTDGARVSAEKLSA